MSGHKKAGAIPGSWNEGLSSGQGLMAVALVIFARWSPKRCLYASLLFGGAGAIGPALQSVGVTQGYYFFNAAPYILTLLIMVGSAGSKNRRQVVSVMSRGSAVGPLRP